MDCSLFCDVLCTLRFHAFQDARVRIFHGDELVLAITPEGEELGFVRASKHSFRIWHDWLQLISQQIWTARDSTGQHSWTEPLKSFEVVNLFEPFP